MKHRNVGIIGANSEASEVFAALLRFEPYKPINWDIAQPCENVDYGAEMEAEKPYDTKDRKRLKWQK